MASVMQKNGLKPLANGGLMQHVEMNKVCAARPVQPQQQQMQYGEDQVQHGITNGQQVLLQHGHLIGHVISQHDNSNVGLNENSVQNDCEPDGNLVVDDHEHSAEVPSGDNEEESDQPEVDIVINNVVCSFSVKCHLNLRQIALNGFNVEYRRENGVSSITYIES